VVFSLFGIGFSGFEAGDGVEGDIAFIYGKVHEGDEDTLMAAMGGVTQVG